MESLVFVLAPPRRGSDTVVVRTAVEGARRPAILGGLGCAGHNFRKSLTGT